MIRVALVDNHRLFRKSIETLLNTFGNIQVIFDTDNGTELMKKLEDTQIDVVLMDIQIREADGIATCKALKEKYPDVRILVLSQTASRELILNIIDIGIDGFFSKNSEPLQLKKAIDTINTNGFHFDSELEFLINDALLWEKKNNNKAVQKSVPMTGREMDVIRLACKEYSSFEIAEILNINVRTVESHRKRIIAKTKTKNFIGVVLYALRHRLLVLESV